MHHIVTMLFFTAGAGWGYFILNVYLLVSVADAVVGTLGAIFTMCSSSWRTAGKLRLTTSDAATVCPVCVCMFFACCAALVQAVD